MLGNPLNLVWKGKISFQPSTANPPPVPSYASSPAPVVSVGDTNILKARNIPAIPAPTPSYGINYTIVFTNNSAGVNIAYVNGKTYVPPAGSTSTGNTSLLFSYLKPAGVHAPPSHVVGRFHYDHSTKLNYSLGDGANPFVLPANKSVLVYIENTDTGEHPIHIHGHSFWVVATSAFPEAETLYKPFYLLRDVVSVPALGWAKIILYTDNPGVWLFHCHIDWHVQAGLVSSIIEAPDEIRSFSGQIPASMTAACSSPAFHSPVPTNEPTNRPTSSSPSTKPSAIPSSPTAHPTSSRPSQTPSAQPRIPSFSPTSKRPSTPTILPTNAFPSSRPR